VIKRFFDFSFAVLLLIVFSVPLFIIWIIACFDTKSNGIFMQVRIGRFREEFYLYKIKTMLDKDRKFTRYGKYLRKFKFDEIPQLFNVLRGDMSFVGPRPDVKGYADKLEGESALILNLRPGITCAASLKYFDEEDQLKKEEDPLLYNNKVIYPDKVKINLNYYYNNNFWLDIKIIIKTVLRIIRL